MKFLRLFISLCFLLNLILVNSYSSQAHTHNSGYTHINKTQNLNKDNDINTIFTIKQYAFILPIIYIILGFMMSLFWLFCIVIYKSEIVKELKLAAKEINKSLQELL